MLAEASLFPLGEKAKAMTHPRCPARRTPRRIPTSQMYRLAPPNPHEAASNRLSGEKAIAVISVGGAFSGIDDFRLPVLQSDNWMSGLLPPTARNRLSGEKSTRPK